ncbi:MAG: MBL fold metallo-hydrolase [bacterium]
MEYKVFEDKSDVSKMKSWDELFGKMKVTELKVVNTGKVRVRKSQVMNLKSEEAVNEGDEILWLTVNAVIVNHPERGIYLLDAGLDTSYKTNKTGLVKGLLKRSIATGSQDRGQSIIENLGEPGENINGIFYTHLHFDHIAGTIDLPELYLYISVKL